MGRLRTVFDKQTRQRQEVAALVDQLLFDMGLDIEVNVNWGEDMFACFTDDSASFDLEYYTESKHRDFLDEIEKWHSINMPIDISFPTFGLLHELGHIISGWFYDNVDDMFEREQVLYNLNNCGKSLAAYKQLPMEMDADQAGYELFKNFHKEIVEFDRKVLEIIYA